MMCGDKSPFAAVFSLLPPTLLFLCLSIPYRGGVSLGAMGVIAPTVFEKRPIET